MDNNTAIKILQRPYSSKSDRPDVTVGDFREACKIGVECIEMIEWMLSNCEILDCSHPDIDDRVVYLADLSEIRDAMKR